MPLMARAAKQAGAKMIRTSSVRDIVGIKEETGLPVIGLIKREYPGYTGRITMTMREVNECVEAMADIVSIDCTDCTRGDGLTPAEFLKKVKAKYPNIIIMADCATLEEARRAQALGFDLVGTTLCGYTQDTLGTPIPSLPLLEAMTRELSVPVIAEGGIWEREQLRQVFAYPVHAAVIGTAITRPREITRRFVEAAGAQEGQYGA